jgi:protein phosphatase
VDDRHIGATVKCGKCAKFFTVRVPAPAAVLRLPAVDAPPLVLENDLPLELDGPGAAAGPVEPTAAPFPASQPSTLPLGLGCLDIGAATSAGQVRTRNEDSWLVQHLGWSNLDQRRDLALVAVADGLGGHEAGDKASGLLIRTLGAALAPLFAAALSDPQADLSAPCLSDCMCRALQDANRAVYGLAHKQAHLRGMGATVAAVLIVDGQAVIGHVGDCRVVHFAGEELRQLTRDQTLVARMVELGQLSEEEALTHPSRNEVTHAVGRHADLTPAIVEVKLATGDWLIAASDGLHAHVNHRDLQNTLTLAPPSALALAHHLVRLADQGGGSDNCTVAAIRYG